MRYWICSLALLSLALAGCGGGGGAGSGGNTTNTQSQFNSAYLEVNLSTGVLRGLDTQGSVRAADTVILKKMPNGMFLGVTELTQGQWVSIMGTRPWMSDVNGYAGGNNAALPAANLTWDEAASFCRALSSRARVNVSLPSVDQLRAAAWPADALPWGADESAATATLYANVGETRGTGQLEAVASRQQYNLIYDLCGNVREWTSDQALFGGGWADNIRPTRRAAASTSVDPEIRHPLSGMRIAARPQ